MGGQEGLFLFIVSGTLFAGHRGSCAVAPTHCRQRAFWKPGQGRCRVCLRELSLGCRIGRFVAVTVWLTSAHKRDQARCLSWGQRQALGGEYSMSLALITKVIPTEFVYEFVYEFGNEFGYNLI
jgi:hypothetical protein